MKGALGALPVARPWFDEREIEAAGRVIRSGWVTQGPEVEAFEREFAAFTGAPHACAVSSGTTALHLVLHALGVGPGDEVVTVSHSFIATANAIVACGARPVFVDIEPLTFNMDPTRLESAIGPRTKAVLCVHQLGMPCDLSEVVAIAAAHGVPVVEDAACAIGSEIRWHDQWQRIGRPHGDVACFSFHPRKLLTTGDGGMITTASARLDRRCRELRQHGMSVSDSVRHGSATVIFESYSEPGFNYRLTDVQAAIGRVQLTKIEEATEERRRLVELYVDRLAGSAGLVLPVEPAWARTNWQSFCVRLDASRDQPTVMQHLLDEGISTRRGVMCAHREPAYPPDRWSCVPSARQCECGPGACARLVESEAAQDHGVILPLFHGMTAADIDRVAAALARAAERAKLG